MPPDTVLRDDQFPIEKSQPELHTYLSDIIAGHLHLLWSRKAYLGSVLPLPYVVAHRLH